MERGSVNFEFTNTDPGEQAVDLVSGRAPAAGDCLENIDKTCG